MDNIISHSDIYTLSLKVTEEIKQKFVIQFIQTNIKQKLPHIPDTSFFYYHFIPEILVYEVFVFQTMSNKIIPEPFCLQQYYENSSIETTDIFCTTHYFMVFKNKVPFLYRSIENLSIEDMKLYLKQIYHLKVDNTIQIDDTKLLNFVNSYKKSPYKLYPLNINNSFNFFIIFFIFTTLFTSYILYMSYSNSIKPPQTTYKLAERKHIKMIPKVIELFKYIKLSHIYIQNIVSKPHKIETTLISKNRSELLDFVNIYHNRITIKSLKYKKDKYFMEISIGL